MSEIARLLELKAERSFHQVANANLIGLAYQRAVIYICRNADGTLLRFGETTDLLARRNTHKGNAAHEGWKKPPNWTETFRPWRMVWACMIPGGDKPCRRKCEDLLSGVLAASFKACDPSGFSVEIGEWEDIEMLATTTVPKWRRSPKFKRDRSLTKIPIGRHG